MKKTLVFGLLLSTAAGMAQPKMGDRAEIEKKKEKIEAIKVAYISEELELTVAESQAFWPVYNELQSKEQELREKQRANFMSLKKDEEISEKELETMIYKMSDIHIAIEELRKSYLDDFIDLLGAKKTLQLIKAEKEFGRRMMERMKGKDRPRDREKRPGTEGRRPMR
jgi:Spy/CpxP family protein refolding chaperone